MTPSEAREKFIAEMKARGVSQWTSAPPLFRLMWAWGAKVPPPHFQGFRTLAISHGLYFGSTWALLMYFVLWRKEEDFSFRAALLAGIVAGILFGVTMAALIRRKAKQLKLPRWEEYLSDPVPMAAKWMIAVGLVAAALSLPGCEKPPSGPPAVPSGPTSSRKGPAGGRLEVVPMPMDRQVNSLHVTPDESLVVGDAAGGDAFSHRGPFYFVLDGQLKPVRDVDGLLGRVAFSPEGRQAISVRRDEATFFDPATLKQVNYCLVAGTPPVLTPWAVCALPASGEWAIVHWGPGVQVIPSSPPWTGRGMGIGIRQPVGAAVDDWTGTLVVIGDENRIELIDSKAMKSLAILTAPCPKLRYDVCATGGMAWVGTSEGTLLPLDLMGRKVLSAVRIGDGGDVALSLSSSGRTLGAVAEKFVDADNHPSVLKAFTVEGGKLVETASMSTTLGCAVSDIAVMERTGRLLVAGKRTYCWWFSE